MLHKISLAFLLSFFFAFSSTSFTSECKIKTEGLYISPIDNEISACIRFYDDGTVLATTSTNNYKEVFTWFNKENKENVLKGKYKIKGCEIKFEVKGESGKQLYVGNVATEELIVEIKNESKTSTKRVYKFIEL